MKNIFNSIQLKRPKSNTFDLTHDVKMTGKMGYLMPILCQEIMPSDRVQLGCDSLIRFAPLIAPVMHRMDVTMHYFFCPTRLVWPGWEKFITNDPTAGAMPFVTIDGAVSAIQSKFLDYMGIPPFPGGGVVTDINAIPFACYQAIYHEYYRDQNLVPEFDYKLTNGDNNGKKGILYNLRKRAWEHDYFTSALPWAQKGASVDIPLGDVKLDPLWGSAVNNPSFRNLLMGEDSGAIDQQVVLGDGFINIGGSTPPHAYDPDGTLKVEATTINTFRRAERLQMWLEKNARGGTRYIENILVHFGIRSSDKRLQRPEYITGVKSPVVISEVLNTTGEASGLPQGNMAGHAVSVGTGKLGTYFAEEHGYIIGIASVLPKPAYSQGIPRTFLKKFNTDFPWPDFAHIGEQEIQNQELMAYTGSVTGTFGYIPRYAEYKFMQSRIAGDFRTSLYFWTLTRDFSGPVGLNQQFIEVDPDDLTDIFAVTGGPEDNLYLHILNKIKSSRPLPVYGSPML